MSSRTFRLQLDDTVEEIAETSMDEDVINITDDSILMDERVSHIEEIQGAASRLVLEEFEQKKLQLKRSIEKVPRFRETPKLRISITPNPVTSNIPDLLRNHMQQWQACQKG